jgi:hypothetical protein
MAPLKRGSRLFATCKTARWRYLHDFPARNAGFVYAIRRTARLQCGRVRRLISGAYLRTLLHTAE